MGIFGRGVGNGVGNECLGWWEGVDAREGWDLGLRVGGWSILG